MAGFYEDAFLRFEDVSREPALAAKAAIAMADCQMQRGDYAGARDTLLAAAPPQADPDWQAYVKASREAGYLIKQQNQLMTPAPFFKLER